MEASPQDLNEELNHLLQKLDLHCKKNEILKDELLKERRISEQLKSRNQILMERDEKASTQRTRILKERDDVVKHISQELSNTIYQLKLESDERKNFEVRYTKKLEENENLEKEIRLMTELIEAKNNLIEEQNNKLKQFDQISETFEHIKYEKEAEKWKKEIEKKKLNKQISKIKESYQKIQNDLKKSESEIKSKFRQSLLISSTHSAPKPPIKPHFKEKNLDFFKSRIKLLKMENNFLKKKIINYLNQYNLSLKNRKSLPSKPLRSQITQIKNKLKNQDDDFFINKNFQNFKQKRSLSSNQKVNIKDSTFGNHFNVFNNRAFQINLTSKDNSNPEEFPQNNVFVKISPAINSNEHINDEQQNNEDNNYLIDDEEDEIDGEVSIQTRNEIIKKINQIEKLTLETDSSEKNKSKENNMLYAICNLLKFIKLSLCANLPIEKSLSINSSAKQSENSDKVIHLKPFKKILTFKNNSKKDINSFSSSKKSNHAFIFNQNEKILTFEDNSQRNNYVTLFQIAHQPQFTYSSKKFPHNLPSLKDKLRSKKMSFKQVSEEIINQNNFKINENQKRKFTKNTDLTNSDVTANFTTDEQSKGGSRQISGKILDNPIQNNLKSSVKAHHSSKKINISKHSVFENKDKLLLDIKSSNNSPIISYNSFKHIPSHEQYKEQKTIESNLFYKINSNSSNISLNQESENKISHEVSSAEKEFLINDEENLNHEMPKLSYSNYNSSSNNKNDIDIYNQSQISNIELLSQSKKVFSKKQNPIFQNENIEEEDIFEEKSNQEKEQSYNLQSKETIHEPSTQLYNPFKESLHKMSFKNTLSKNQNENIFINKEIKINKNDNLFVSPQHSMNQSTPKFSFSDKPYSKLLKMNPFETNPSMNTKILSSKRVTLDNTTNTSNSSKIRIPSKFLKTKKKKKKKVNKSSNSLNLKIKKTKLLKPKKSVNIIYKNSIKTPKFSTNEKSSENKSIVFDLTSSKISKKMKVINTSNKPNQSLKKSFKSSQKSKSINRSNYNEQSSQKLSSMSNFKNSSVQNQFNTHTSEIKNKSKKNAKYNTITLDELNNSNITKDQLNKKRNVRKKKKLKINISLVSKNINKSEKSQN